MNEEKYKELLENYSSTTNEFDDYTEMKLHLTYNEEPLPYSRPRFVRRGKHIGTYNERENDMKKIRNHFQNSLSIEEKNLIYKIISNSEKNNYYVKVEGKIYIKIPKVVSMKNHILMEKGIMRPTVHRGDVDNYIKLALDVLHEVVYDDDTHVTDIIAGKYYSDNPRTELDITIYYNKKVIE